MANMCLLSRLDILEYVCMYSANLNTFLVLKDIIKRPFNMQTYTFKFDILHILNMWVVARSLSDQFKTSQPAPPIGK